jgi:hypothetical protein
MSQPRRDPHQRRTTAVDGIGKTRTIGRNTETDFSHDPSITPKPGARPIICPVTSLPRTVMAIDAMFADDLHDGMLVLSERDAPLVASV